MTNEEIARFFNKTQAFIQRNPDLRDPQVEGLYMPAGVKMVMYGIAID